MVVALASDLSQDWFLKASGLLADEAMVLPVTADGALDLAHRLPVSILILNAEPLISERLVAYQRLVAALPEAVVVCLATADTRDQIRSERLLAPDFWLAPTAEVIDVEEALHLARGKAALVANNASPFGGPGEQMLPVPGNDTLTPEEGILRQLLAAMAGNTDPNRLLQTYADSAVQLVRCASYCFLHRDPYRDVLVVRSAQGLPPQLVAHGRLGGADALPRWYRNNCRALTRGELAHWPDAAVAAPLARELDIFRGHVAIPLIIGGRLDGLLILGEKVIGGQYSHSELETLFVLTGYVGLHLENLHLQDQMNNTQAYMERSLCGMRCGLVTLGRDERIAVCNPYAAGLLHAAPEQLEGADLRALPSPLGDYLYAAFRSPEAAVNAENVELPALGLQLRVTTSTLLDRLNEPIGSVLLLEDVTGPMEIAAQASRQDTINVLTRIIGRIAHEVRTPLTAIKTYAQLMDQPDDYQDLIAFWRDTVSPELERLEELITEQVRLVEQPAPDFQLVNVEQLVGEAIDQIRANNGNGGDQGPGAPLLKVVAPVSEVVADPGPTRDALSYLLRYLCEHAHSQVGVVLDESHRGTVPTVRVRMRVAANGNGAGFDPHTILDPLAALQAEEGDLGPAISRQLVDRMGGKVEALNGDGYFEFRVLFPVNVVDKPVGRP